MAKLFPISELVTKKYTFHHQQIHDEVTKTNKKKQHTGCNKKMDVQTLHFSHWLLKKTDTPAMSSYWTINETLTCKEPSWSKLWRNFCCKGKYLLCSCLFQNSLKFWSEHLPSYPLDEKFYFTKLIPLWLFINDLNWDIMFQIK